MSKLKIKNFEEFKKLNEIIDFNKSISKNFININSKEITKHKRLYSKFQIDDEIIEMSHPTIGPEWINRLFKNFDGKVIFGSNARMKHNKINNENLLNFSFQDHITQNPKTSIINGNGYIRPCLTIYDLDKIIKDKHGKTDKIPMIELEKLTLYVQSSNNNIEISDDFYNNNNKILIDINEFIESQGITMKKYWIYTIVGDRKEYLKNHPWIHEDDINILFKKLSLNYENNNIKFN